MGEMAPQRQTDTDFQSNQSLSSVELGVKLSTGLGRSVCSTAVFPATASAYSDILFPEQCFSNLGVWCAGLSRLGPFIEPQAGPSADGVLSVQDCPMPAALGLRRGSCQQSRERRQDCDEDLGSHGGLAGRQVGAGS